MPARGDRREPVAVPLRHGVRRSVRLQQRSALESGDRRHPRLHDGRRGETPLLRSRVGQGDLAARPARRVPGAAGLLRHRVHTAGRGTAADRQRRRTGRTLCRRTGQDDGQGSVARRQGMGAKLRVTGARRDPRQAARLRVRGRRVDAADRRPHVDRPGKRERGFLVPLAQPQLRVGQRVVPGGVRQQGVHLRQLPRGRRARRDPS